MTNQNQEESILLVPGAHQKALNVEGKNSASAMITGTTMTKLTENGKKPMAGLTEPLQAKLEDQKPKNTMNETRNTLMQDVKNGEKTIQNDNLKISEQIITKTECSEQQQSENVVTPEILPESSDDSRRNLTKAGLDSMTLLSKSANKLMSIMNSCVSDTELSRMSEGGAKVEVYRSEQAIQCANAIAQTVQTQVNLVKAMSSIMKSNL